MIQMSGTRIDGGSMLYIGAHLPIGVKVCSRDRSPELGVDVGILSNALQLLLVSHDIVPCRQEFGSSRLRRRTRHNSSMNRLATM